MDTQWVSQGFFMGFDLQICHSLTLCRRRSALRLWPELTAWYENNVVHCCGRASELSIRLCILVRKTLGIYYYCYQYRGKKIRDSIGFEPITGYCISTAVLDQWSYEHPHIKSRMICWVHFNLWSIEICTLVLSLFCCLFM